MVQDKRGRVIILRARQPESILVEGKPTRWEDVLDGMEAAIKQMRQDLAHLTGLDQHGRGDYPALTFGMTMGPGCRVSWL